MIRVYESGAVVYDDSTLTDSDKIGSILIESIPEPDMPEGMIAELRASVEENLVYYVYKGKPKPEIEVMKDCKYREVCESYNKSLETFSFEGNTFECSADAKTHLVYVLQKIQTDPTFVQQWFFKDYTYVLGEQDSIFISASNVRAFQVALESRMNSLTAWKKGAEYWLAQAATIEEVEAIDTVYHG